MIGDTTGIGGARGGDRLGEGVQVGGGSGEDKGEGVLGKAGRGEGLGEAGRGDNQNRGGGPEGTKERDGTVRIQTSSELPWRILRAAITLKTGVFTGVTLATPVTTPLEPLLAMLFLGRNVGLSSPKIASNSSGGIRSSVQSL